ncbi:DUF378 domain-containing protein [Sporosarcina siberiensis]|uniref:DUF378 domain-containing protein n=1 Tax=Sporosarcina siberiensis TaxID=1365606 RepID=A0ABW4SI95_9BACL
MRTIQRIALALVIIGAINWGLIALFQFDLVATLFGGQGALLSRAVYGLVGLSGIVCLGLLFSPMEDVDEVVVDRTERGRLNKLNYDTEFGEETGFVKRPTEFKKLDEHRIQKAQKDYNNKNKKK